MGNGSILYYDEWESPVGTITILMANGKLCRIDFGSMKNIASSLRAWAKQHYLCTEFCQDNQRLAEVKQQLAEYFDGDRKTFTIDFRLHGTPFQKKVWEVLNEQIPYGQTRSYKDIAQKIQAPKAIRAVGGAINKNPLSIFIPCHRVIGSNGSLVGYNGGLEKKKQLLHLEKAPIRL